MTDTPNTPSPLAFCGAVLLAAVLLIGCGRLPDQPGPDDTKPNPTPVISGTIERLSYEAERAIPAKYADGNDAIAKRIEAGEIDSAAELKAAITESDKAARTVTYDARDVAFTKAVQPGDNFDAKAAVKAVKELSAGRRRAAR